jgi:hypothetical protein
MGQFLRAQYCVHGNGWRLIEIGAALAERVLTRIGRM